MASRAELLVHMQSKVPLGRHLFDALGSVAAMAGRHGVHLGETYILGDSPLVLLTALQSSFHPDPASSTYVSMPCPRLTDSGAYESNPGGRVIRVYRTLGTRLLLADLYAKLALHARAGRAARRPLRRRSSGRLAPGRRRCRWRQSGRRSRTARRGTRRSRCRRTHRSTPTGDDRPAPGCPGRCGPACGDRSQCRRASPGSPRRSARSRRTSPLGHEIATPTAPRRVLASDDGAVLDLHTAGCRAARTS